MIQIAGYMVEANSMFIRVIACTPAGTSCLKQLGFAEDGESEFVLTINAEFDLAHLFELLRSSEFAFSGGREWSPSELFEYFRDQGKISGNYIRITWINSSHTNLAIC